jgi:hypothetical protein
VLGSVGAGARHEVLSSGLPGPRAHRGPTAPAHSPGPGFHCPCCPPFLRLLWGGGKKSPMCLWERHPPGCGPQQTPAALRRRAAMGGDGHWGRPRPSKGRRKGWAGRADWLGSISLPVTPTPLPSTLEFCLWAQTQRLGARGAGVLPRPGPQMRWGVGRAGPRGFPP